MRPFDLGQALAGHPVQTRDGRPVTQLVKFDCESEYCVVGIADSKPISWLESGRYIKGMERDTDLFMAPVKKTGWVARRIYHREKTFYTSGEIYATEQIAKECEPHAISYHKIEWEE